MSNNILKSIILSVALVFFLPFYSCKKTKETIGIVIVKDINGQLISGATVTLHQDGQISPQGNLTDPSVRRTETTDSNGRAQFIYDLEAVLNISVTKIDGNDQLSGTGIIRLLREKTVTQQVEIN
tara:strand:- start:595 stop:969 length:375 start_codon:yes stop_codon:yes gene_type:complete